MCGIYGSITQKGMKEVFDCLRHNTGLDGTSTLVDIGAGLGRQVAFSLYSATRLTSVMAATPAT